MRRCGLTSTVTMLARSLMARFALMKLANGLDDVLAEFSLIVEMDGVHYAMGGNVLIGGAQVAAMNGFTVGGPTPWTSIFANLRREFQ